MFSRKRASNGTSERAARRAILALVPKPNQIEGMSRFGVQLRRWQRECLDRCKLLLFKAFSLTVGFLRVADKDIYNTIRRIDDAMLGKNAEAIASNANYLKQDDLDHTMQQINLEFSGVYSKAASLLQHISLMIAALTIIYGPTTTSIVRRIIILNVLIYLFALLFVLRVIWIARILEPDLNQRILLQVRELMILKNYLRFALQIAAIMTPLLAAMFILSEIFG
ncbi:MAG: hypothetical protein ABSC06_19765 [Rhodopila sp.]